MIAAAVTLFARSGFNGVTTKEIAQSAHVSDGNIYRYFPTKRDLFICAFESELQKLTADAEALTLIADAEDSRIALHTVLELLTKSMVKQPELVRLLHFSALEFKPDTEAIFQRHVHPIFEALKTHGKKRSRDHASCDISPMTTILFFIATVIVLQDFLPSFSGCASPFESVESVATYAELWCQVISTTPTPDTLTV